MRQVIGLLVLLCLVLILLLALLHLIARLHVNRLLQNLFKDIALALFIFLSERSAGAADGFFKLVLLMGFVLSLLLGRANSLVALEFHVEDLLLLLLFLRFLIFVLADVVHLGVGVANEVRPDIRVGFGRDLALLVVVENCNFSLLVL